MVVSAVTPSTVKDHEPVQPGEEGGFLSHNVAPHRHPRSTRIAYL